MHSPIPYLASDAATHTTGTMPSADTLAYDPLAPYLPYGQYARA